MQPKKGSKFEGRGSAKIEKSDCSKGKVIVSFRDGASYHIPESMVSEFFVKDQPKPKPSKKK